jgi:hypothetical protein
MGSANLGHAYPQRSSGGIEQFERTSQVAAHPVEQNGQGSNLVIARPIILFRIKIAQSHRIGARSYPNHRLDDGKMQQRIDKYKKSKNRTSPDA